MSRNTSGGFTCFHCRLFIVGLPSNTHSACVHVVYSLNSLSCMVRVRVRVIGPRLAQSLPSNTHGACVLVVYSLNSLSCIVKYGR